MRLKPFFLFVSIVLLISSCTEDRPDIDTKPAPPIEIVYKRLDKDLFEAEPLQLDSLAPRLQTKYGDFLNLYCENILHIGTPGTPGFVDNLGNFITEPNLKQVYKDSKAIYDDFGPYEAELNDAWARYHQEFPDSLVPEVITCISGFNFAVMAAEKSVGIGLEMYLGANSIYYNMLGLPQYKIRFMRPESLTPGVMKGWMAATFPYYAKNSTLLAHMVHSGKILYSLDRLLPETEDSLKIDFTAAQIEFVKENESKVWSHFMENQLLYSTDGQNLTKYMSEGPFTAGLPRELPARLGEYLGWQIVRKYMQNNPDVSLQQLFDMQDAQEILTQSKYKPDR